MEKVVNKRSYGLAFSVLLIILLSLGSCQDKDQVFFKKISYDNSFYWTYEQPFAFDVDMVDTSKVYDIIVHFKHSKDYPFENLYYIVEIKHSEQNIQKDTFNIDLINRSGLWNGHCNAQSCRLSTIALSRQPFGEGGGKKINIYQHTRRDSLPGIQEIALEIRKSQSLERAKK